MFDFGGDRLSLQNDHLSLQWIQRGFFMLILRCSIASGTCDMRRDQNENIFLDSREI